VKQRIDFRVLLTSLVLGILLATASPYILSGASRSIPPNPIINSIPQLSRAYKSSFSILEPSGKSIGAATIVRWKPGQKILAISAYHLFMGRLNDIHTVGLSTLSRSRYTIDWYIKMRVAAVRSQSDLVLLESLEVTRVSGPFVLIGPYLPVGSRVHAIGAPRGYQRNVTAGIISNIIKTDTTYQYKSDVAVYKGSSGGGLFDSEQRLVGVASAFGYIMIVPGVYPPVPGEAFFIHTVEINKLIRESNEQL